MLIPWLTFNTHSSFNISCSILDVLKVACPSISDPAEKYMSLIIPAFNEEQRLPGALEDTMK